jgi:quercetin dioxygenase-like cupin family protein
MVASESYRVLRLSEDRAGESHFDEFEVARSLTKFAPPALPFFVSEVAEASGYVVVRIPAGWKGELHPSPHRQILFCWSGTLKVTATDGSVRTVTSGDVWLMEDTRGKGHWSEVPSEVPFDAVIILVPKPG